MGKVSNHPRVVLYSHDGLGLGHLRITLVIAYGLAAARPDASILILTGSPHVHHYVLPPRCDAVSMPSLEKRALFTSSPAREADPHAPEDIFTVREAIITAILDSFAPHLLLVDHNPAGLAGELGPALAAVRTRRSRPKLVAGLRDITYGPAETRTRWHDDGVYELLDQFYDHILVYGQREVFDPIAAYGLSPAVAAKTTFTGYLRRPELVRPPAEIREEHGATSRPLVVVTVGGGVDGEPVLRAYLEALSGGALPGIVSCLVAGPQLPEREFAQLQGLATGLPDLTLATFHPDLASVLAAADVVVSMGGYNTVCEAVAAGKRPIIIPRAHGSDEQRLRAERFAALGLVSILPQPALTPEELAGAIAAEMARGISPPARLDFGGVERASATLSRLLSGCGMTSMS